MKISLSFVDPISEAYREKLQTFSDTILAQGITENRSPYIWFPGVNEETLEEIEKLHHDYDRSCTAKFDI